MVYLSKQKESNLHHYELFHSADWTFFNRVALLTNRYPFPKMLVSGYFNNVISWLSSRASIATTPTPLVGVLPLHHTSINFGAFDRRYCPGPPSYLTWVCNRDRTCDLRNHNPPFYQLNYAHHMIRRASLLPSGDPHRLDCTG